MSRKTVSVRRLEAAGFTVLATHEGRWYEVEKGGGAGLVCRQDTNCWHWFSKAYQATASHCNPECCDIGGLGDAIGTDAQMRTYKRLINAAPAGLRASYAGLWAACGQARSEAT